MLKITVPFKEKDEVVPLIKAGADELYCGYISKEWIKKYTDLEFERKGGKSNFTDIKDLKEAVDTAHKHNTLVYLTLNGLYVRRQYPALLRIVKEANEVNLDGYIVADMGLLLTLKEIGFKKEIHISTGGTVFNSQAVDFFRKFGISRIVLDRQTTLESMRAISRENPNIGFEVFILNTLCVHIDGFCTFLHTYGAEQESGGRICNKAQNSAGLRVITGYDHQAYADACSLKYRVQAFDAGHKKIRQPWIRPVFYKHLTDGIECGACALYDISRTKIKTVKIVGRQLNAEIRLKSTRFIRSALDILKNDQKICREDFIRLTQGLYRQTFGYKKKCSGNNCYYNTLQ